MNQDLTSVDARPTDRAARRAELKRLRWRRLSRTALIAAGVLALLWLVAGGIYYVLQVRAHALAAQSQLQRAKQSLLHGNGDSVAAEIAGARVDVREARGYAGKAQLDLIGRVPYLGRSVADMRHLVSAADSLSTVSESIAHLYGRVSGGKLIANNQIDLAALRNADAQIPLARQTIRTAEDQLKAVHGYFWEPGVGSARNHVLDQVTDLDHRLKDVAPVLKVLPDVFGASGQRRYVIAVLNPAELRFSGGATLSVALVTFDHGHYVIDHRGQLGDLAPHSPIIDWTGVPGDPWQNGHNRLVNATFAPDWPTAGEEFLRAYEAQFGINADGVIGIDPVALAGLLRATGPFVAPGYGEITADNLVQKAVADAYVDHRNREARHELNDQLMDIMITRLTHGGAMMGKLRALGASLATKHLQIYSRRGQLQALLAQKHVAGAFPKPGADIVSLFTQNTNGSKLDIFQRRSIVERVVVRTDGSADVTRTLTVSNDAPAYQGPGKDPGSGYLTAISAPFLATYAPASLSGLSMEVNGNAVQPHTRLDHGWLAVTQSLVIPRGDKVVVTVRYHLPRALVRSKHILRYELHVLSQPVISPASFTLSIVLPKNYRVLSAPGFARENGALTLRQTLGGERTLAISMSRS